MRVNATKGITSNQPLIAGCRPLMLGRQAADLNLVWLDLQQQPARAPLACTPEAASAGSDIPLCRHLFILSDEMTPLIC